MSGAARQNVPPEGAPTLLITTLAEYQTRFWLLVAQWLQARGYDVRVLAFDDRSAEMLEAAGVPCANMHASGLGAEAELADPAKFRERLKSYGIEEPNLLLSHERVTFAIRDTGLLARRFMIYSNAMEKVLDELAAKGRRAVLLQELGGFLSVIVSYFAARRRGIDNWFIEPSFFRGRLFLIPNSFAALQAMERPATAVSADVRRYLDDTLAKQAIVVPLKDRHQYAPAFAKVLNAQNVRRLWEKLYDQYVLGKHQEFGHNLKHAWNHALMAQNAVRMRPHYRAMPAGTPFVYFPLHVPADMALTLRSPEFLDQVSLVDYLLRVVPMSHKVAIKEHPAQIGAIPATRLQQLVKRYDNLVVLPPKTNNYDVLRRADAVVTVNSKSGAEALLLGRPVLVLGDGFYSKCPLVFRVGRLPDLPARLKDALESGGVDPSSVAPYFQSAWDLSHPGELYVTGQDQVPVIAASIADTVCCR
jgi:Capsule polysaccharide biosynthesis protein